MKKARNKRGQFKRKANPILKLIEVILAAIIIYMLINIFANKIPESVATSAEPIEFQTIYVVSGDTLWTIAKPYAEEAGKDIRDVIYNIKKDNDMTTSEIYAGQSLLIRVNY